MTSYSIECCIRMPGAQTVRHFESLFEDVPVEIKEAFQNTRYYTEKICLKGMLLYNEFLIQDCRALYFVHQNISFNCTSLIHSSVYLQRASIPTTNIMWLIFILSLSNFSYCQSTSPHKPMRATRVPRLKDQQCMQVLDRCLRRRSQRPLRWQARNYCWRR